MVRAYFQALLGWLRRYVSALTGSVSAETFERERDCKSLYCFANPGGQLTPPSGFLAEKEQDTSHSASCKRFLKVKAQVVVVTFCVLIYHMAHATKYFPSNKFWIQQQASIIRSREAQVSVWKEFAIFSFEFVIPCILYLEKISFELTRVLQFPLSNSARAAKDAMILFKQSRK